MEYLYLIIGVLLGCVISAWSLWGTFQREKKEMQELYFIAQGYENLKKLMKGGK